MGSVLGAGSLPEPFQRAIARLAANQHGVFSRAQATELGASKSLIRRRLDAGTWEAVARNVFRLAGCSATWHQSLMVACLAWGVGAVISHRAAAAFWRLVGFAQSPVELTVPKTRQRQRLGVVHRGLLLPRDVTVVDAIPVTTPVRTLLDIAATAAPERVEEALDDALRRRIVTIPQLRRRLRDIARQGRPGVTAIRSMLEARDASSAVPESVLETRLLNLLKRHRLPAPLGQYPIHDETGLVGRIDFAWPDAKLALEGDGFRWHSGRSRFESDRLRRNRLTLLGWRVVHVTWTQMNHDPDSVAEAVRRALRG
jgi:very-short-patch-repair endonuclease/predicted transcriptional regulator of viral defense system